MNSINAKSAVVILSGGMDSTIALRLAVEQMGAANVHAISFDYGQKQYVEIQFAHESCKTLRVKHEIVSLMFLGMMSQGFSANVQGSSIQMPTIKDVIGDPRPATYVPNRNMIMLSIAASYAEVNGLEKVICGLQARDEYNYHDTTPEFVQCINDALSMNRKHHVEIIAPFNELTKKQEIEILLDLDGNVDLLKSTMTCYNPDMTDETNIRSCGKCPTCAERIKAFMDAGIPDPVPYSVDIPWRTPDGVI